MSENTNTSAGQPGTKGLIHAGLKLPPMAAGELSPSFLSSAFGNKVIAVANAVMNMRVNRQLVEQQQDGTYTPRGTVNVSDERIDINLFDAPTLAGGGGSGGSSVILGRVTSESSEYITVQPITATGDGTYIDAAGAAFNVAKPVYLRGLTGVAISPQYTDATFFRIFSIQSPTGGTGVFVSGSDVGYVDANVDARLPAGAFYFLDTYNGSTAYILGDVVRVANGSDWDVYVCVVAGTGNTPTWPEPGGTVYWKHLAGPSASGGGIACTLVSIWSTYYLVTDGTNYYRAAKPDSIMAGYGATIVGVSFTYGALTGTTTTYPASMVRTSTATSGPNSGFVENQIVNPMPQAGWALEILAGCKDTLTVDGGDTSHGGSPGAAIVYTSADNWGCAWFAPYDQVKADW